MATYFIEKTIGAKVDSAQKFIEGEEEDKDSREKKKKEAKEQREMEERKRKYLEERRVKRHEENKARNDGIRNKYTLSEKEDKSSSSFSFFSKEEPKKQQQQPKKNPSKICIVEGCPRTASVVRPICPNCEQPVCYNHRLETDHPCSTVAAVKGAAGSMFDSLMSSVESAKNEFGAEGGGKGEGREGEGERGGGSQPVVQRGSATEKEKEKETEEEDVFSLDYLSKRFEETKESLSDVVDSSLRELNLAGEPELTEEEKRYWGGIEEKKEVPAHHLPAGGGKEEEKGVFDEVSTSISSWLNGEEEKGGSQQKESEGSSFFSSWF